ncbi:MAG TPA: alkene reductase [Caulobacteraceae bacterium]|nr:alkene reductase [Caulobacteraceae bacterium]
MSQDLSILFQPFELKGVRLKNRFVMPAMTRARTPAPGTPTPLNALYYAQRAGAGLVIAEGTNPTPGGSGFPGVPAIFAPEHVEGWRRVAEAVHGAGGRLFVQLWHGGRISSAAWQPDGRPPLGASAVQAQNALFLTPDGQRGQPDTPREATQAEIDWLVEGFAKAARNAIDAGCDGVEIHGANGYLVHQFFSDRANVRTDGYGGTPKHRIRFAVEIAEAIAAEVGAERTAIRISPLAAYQDAPVSDPSDVYPLLLAELDRLDVAYVHCVEGEPSGINTGQGAPEREFDFPAARRLFRGAWIANNGYDPGRAARTIAAGNADMVSFGRPFLSNPDYPERVRLGAPLNTIDNTTAYAGQAERGYTDYPALETQAAE